MTSAAPLCGVEFVVTKDRREKRAQRESCLKGVRSLYVAKATFPNPFVKMLVA